MAYCLACFTADWVQAGLNQVAGRYCRCWRVACAGQNCRGLLSACCCPVSLSAQPQPAWHAFAMPPLSCLLCCLQPGCNLSLPVSNYCRAALSGTEADWSDCIPVRTAVSDVAQVSGCSVVKVLGRFSLPDGQQPRMVAADARRLLGGTHISPANCELSNLQLAGVVRAKQPAGRSTGCIQKRPAEAGR